MTIDDARVEEMGRMETAFTKGPWVVFYDGERFEVAVGQFGEDRICEPLGDTHEQAEANGHLIAAAPDLYEMTEWLERIFIYEAAKAEKDRPQDDEGVRLRKLNLGLVQAALAKARGTA